MKIPSFFRRKVEKAKEIKEKYSPTQNGYVFKTENLCKGFDGSYVLKNINLRIKEGEIVAVVGGSGCGKTTLVKHFNGFNFPDSGRVFAYGEDLSRVSEPELEEIRKKIGYVFQANALLCSLSVLDNVGMMLKEDPLYGENTHEIGQRAERVLEEVGLNIAYFNRYPSELSGGQRKRVAIARAIASNPPAVIYDEPTTGLDPGTSKKISDLILKLHKNNGNTSIAITHDRDLMEAMGERIIFLDRGVVKFDGSYSDFRNSQDERIKSFLG